MEVFFSYMFKLTIGLTVVYLVYWILLRRLTFHNWNRWYLLLVSIATFIIPFIDVSFLFQQDYIAPGSAIHFIPSVDSYSPVKAVIADASKFDVYEWLLFVIIGGMLILTAKLLIQLLSFSRLLSSADILVEAPVRVFKIDKQIIPFSFANSIFINPALHSEEELKDIVLHELIHVKQKHSIDIIVSELICILNWYNPFVWLLKKAIRQNLEFIADEHLIRTGLDKRQYQYLLLKVTGLSHFSIATKFNFTSLKTRIAMMNKTKSGRAQLLKFLVAIPLIAAVVVAFRNEPQTKVTDTQSIQKDTVPRKVHPPVPPKVSDLPANVRSISITDDAAIVKLKDGTKEMYNLDDPEERKTYEAKYGPVPEPPDPPEPPTVVKAPEPPHVVVAPKEYTDFLKRNQNVKNLQWRSKPNRIIINFKDGSKEEIASDDENAMKNATAKYGRFPVAPPAPPPPPAAPAAPIPPDPPAKEGSTTTNKTVAPSASHVYSFSAVDELTVSTVKGFTGVKPATGSEHVTTVLTAEVIEFDNGMQKSPDDKVDLIVQLSRNTNKATLDQLISDLAAKGYTLKFDLIEFENQQLSTVKGSISYKDNKSHFTASDFSELSIGWVRQVNGKTGFRIFVHNGSVKI